MFQMLSSPNRNTGLNKLLTRTPRKIRSAIKLISPIFRQTTNIQKDRRKQIIFWWSRNYNIKSVFKNYFSLIPEAGRLGKDGEYIQEGNRTSKHLHYPRLRYQPTLNESAGCPRSTWIRSGSDIIDLTTYETSTLRKYKTTNNRSKRILDTTCHHAQPVATHSHFKPRPISFFYISNTNISPTHVSFIIVLSTPSFRG